MDILVSFSSLLDGTATPSTLASTMAPLRRLAFLALSAAAFASLASPVLGDDSSHAHTLPGRSYPFSTDPGADPAATDAAAKAGTSSSR